MTKNECREVEVPVCTKEPATVPKEVCKEIPREVRIPNDLSNSEGGDKNLFENVWCIAKHASFLVFEFFGFPAFNFWRLCNVFILSVRYLHFHI